MTRNMHRQWLYGITLLSFLWLTGCAHLQNKNSHSNAPIWSGRIAIQIAPHEQQQTQSINAGFSLEGEASHGTFSLFNPFGNTEAVLTWTPNHAELVSRGKKQEFDSLATLTTELLGTELPITTLFDWLAGIATPINNWHADFSQLNQGRLTAQQISPPITLRIKFNPEETTPLNAQPTP